MFPYGSVEYDWIAGNTPLVNEQMYNCSSNKVRKDVRLNGVVLPISWDSELEITSALLSATGKLVICDAMLLTLSPLPSSSMDLYTSWLDCLLEITRSLRAIGSVLSNTNEIQLNTTMAHNMTKNTDTENLGSEYTGTSPPLPSVLFLHSGFPPTPEKEKTKLLS